MSAAKMDKFKDTFKEEAKELLAGLESSLLVLEKDPLDADEISAVFRAMHTIKGSASMFGFDFISSFTHELENLFDHVRNGQVKMNPEMVTAMLACRDHISALLEDETNVDLQSNSAQLLERVFDAADAKSLQRIPVAADSADQDDDAADIPAVPTASSRASNSEKDPLATYRIRFVPEAGIFANGTRPTNLISELAELGDLSVIPYFDKIPVLAQIDPEICYVYWDLLLSTRRSLAEIKDIFLFVQDTAQVTITPIDFPEDETSQDSFRIGDILVNRGALSTEGLQQAIAKQRRIGEVLIEDGVPPEQIKAALEEQQHIRRVREKIQSENSTSTIRVASEKLDSLVDLVGELVTLQARLSQSTGDLENANLTGISEQLERLTDELRDSTMSIRMLPIGSTFTRFKRLVRDLSQELGKEIEFLTEGGETELDKTVIDKLSEPLVHLIRNSIDHGIEVPSIRRATGKRPEGRLTLKAEHAGASVHIIIEDDGKGLDPEVIRKKAVEKGLISASAELNDQSIFQLITAPGFSTAEAVTKVSGRGVGMDVVKREIEALGGNLIIDSQKGSKTRIVLDIPLTLAIIEGLLVNTGDEHFVFPLSLVEECIEYTVEHKDGRSIMSHRNEVLPIIKLREQLQIPNEAPDVQQIVVIHASDQKVGIVVDYVIGSHQTVVKSLGKVYKSAEGISGATILGDGSIALILDVNRLVKSASLATDRVHA